MSVFSGAINEPFIARAVLLTVSQCLLMQLLSVIQVNYTGYKEETLRTVEECFQNPII